MGEFFKGLFSLVGTLFKWTIIFLIAVYILTIIASNKGVFL